MSNAENRRRGPRRRAIPDSRYLAAKARWERARAAGELIASPIPKGTEAPDSARMAVDLRRLFDLTGDPAFETALHALKAYGLDAASPRDGVDRYWERTVPEWAMSLQLMFNLMMHWKDREERSSVRAAAAEAAARLKLPAVSFDGIVKKLTDRYFEAAKANSFPMPDQKTLGEIGMIRAVPVEGRDAHGLPKEGANVLNNCQWRRAIARGDVSARIVLEETSLKNSNY